MDISGFSVKYMTRDYVEMLYKKAWDNYNAGLIDPESVNHVSMYTSPSLKGAIALSTDLARSICFVVSYYSHSLTAIDVSNPAAMSEIQSYSSLSLNAPYGVHCDYDNNIALVASYENNQLTAIDISDPSAMTEVSSYSSLALEGALIMAVDPVGGVIYAAPYYKEPIIALETIDSSGFIKNIKKNKTGAFDNPWGVSADVDGEIAFFPDYDESGIRAFSFSVN
jgi:DNA-binding beta-propeller fold protein YncE